MTPPVTWFIAKGAIFVMLCLTIGCSTSGPAPIADHFAWELSQGGITTGPELHRLERLTQVLLHPGCTSIRVHLLQTAEPCAYSFKDGQIYVSRGLCVLLDDSELAAAIAHELGHLANDGCYPVPAPLAASHRDVARAIALPKSFSLRGDTLPQANHDPEAAADDTGMKFLAAAHLDPTAMSRMLRHLASAHSPSPIRTQIAARASRLQS